MSTYECLLRASDFVSQLECLRQLNYFLHNDGNIKSQNKIIANRWSHCGGKLMFGTGF